MTNRAHVVIYCLYILSTDTHPVISFFLLHGVRVEESDDSARLRLPVLFVDFAEKQKRHEHFQVMEVVQFPDAKGFALQRESAQSKWDTHTQCFHKSYSV